jgi:hypothetical protein
MPVYEYQGKHYDLSETDSTAAKTKIQGFLEKEKPSADLSSQIPTGGYPTVEKKEQAGEPKFLEKAAMYASAVPAGGLAAGALKTASAGSRFAPYAANLAEALVPKTLGGLTKATGGAAATGAASEGARSIAERRGASPGTQTAVELGTSLGLGGLGYGAQKLGTAAKGLYGTAMGKETKPLAESLRSKAQQALVQPTQQTQKELGQTEKVLGQMAQKPQVAAGRVQPVTPGPQAAEREAVREKLGAQVSKADVAERSAQQRVQMAQNDLQKSQAAVDQLEASLAGKPGITADELGRSLQSTTAKLSKDGVVARKKAAGYDTVFQNAGEKLSVDTTGLLSSVDKLYRQTRNPNLQNILSELKRLGQTGKGINEAGEFVGEKALSLKSADSLKGYLDSIISSKQHKETKLDRETLQTIRNLKNQLMMKANNAHPEYKEAINKFREMSRPLDIVERNGSLKKVIDTDPVSTAYRMTEAEVTGHVIRKANAGNPTFTRLLQTNPQLKDSARLYFTKDLFGKDAAPTVKSFENWLSTNERSLRQTGLYDEFSTLRNSQKAARDAVDQAKGVAEIAEERLSAAAQKKADIEGLAKKATGRLTEALKTGETPSQLAQRVEKAKTTPVPGQAKFVSQADKQQRSLETLSELQSNLTRATKPGQIKTEVTATAEKLKDLGLISEQQRDQMLREVAALGDSIEAREEALRRVVRIVAGTAALAGVGYGGRQVAGALQ